jgi:CIC family chloride channel protein
VNRPAIIQRITLLTVIGLLTGAVVGLLAVGFVEAVLRLNDHLLVSPLSKQTIANPAWLTAATLGIPTAAGLLVGMLALATPERRFLGPPDAIRTAQTPDGEMPVKAGLVTTAAACVSLGAGASVGQYGPLVHMGASFGSWIRHTLNADRSLGPIGIACGAAAAISAAFHAPLAGLVFAREVILRHYSLRAFAPIAVASTVAYVVDHVVFGRAPLFQVEQHIVAHSYEYALFIVIGISGALLATVYMRAIDVAGRIANSLRWPLPVKTAAAGLALGIVALELPEVLGIGQEVLREAMAGDVFSAADLGSILVAKLLLTALCLGLGFAGGVFSPALLIGTLFGALVAAGMSSLTGGDTSHVAIYAVCGLVAVASPVIGAPLTTVLIVFELTQNFDLATASLLSVAFANLVGYRIYGRSMFDVQLQERGFDLSLGRDKVIVQQHTIRELLEDDLATGKPHDSGGEAQPGILELHPDTTIWDAVTAVSDFEGERINVVENGNVTGNLSRSAIVGAYLEIISDVRREEHAAD